MNIEENEIKQFSEFDEVTPQSTQNLITDGGRFSVGALYNAVIAYATNLINAAVAAATSTATTKAAEASTKATQAITAATEAMTSANFAAEVSRIAIVPITGTTQTIAPNKCYTLLTNDVDTYTLTPEMPSSNPEYLLQAVVQLKTGSAAPVINWGGNPSFFNGKIPTINANSSYDVIFEFDNITLSWSVGVMKK